jgi:serine/threonine protein kinase/tetratricopeptide (TPR) repeat protein
MDAQRWERAQRLFHAAAELPAAERDAYVAAHAGSDAALAREVRAMLRADVRAALVDAPLARIASAVLETTSAPLPSVAFGHYRAVRVLGEGGMGVVYLGVRADLGSAAAIKVLRDAWLSPARRERFIAEQRTLAQLVHPAIAQLYDADALPDGTPWFALEYVDGAPITDYCRERGTTLEGRIELFAAACSAVQHAHSQAVIHRDLKPSNIFVTRAGAVKLLDFGIAKHLENLADPVDQTRTGLRLMTPAYAAPEQIRGERVGIHTDIYSLGVVLYELLTERTPFDLSGLTPAEAASAIAEREPERPSHAVARARGRSAVRRVSGPSGIAWADLDVLCLTAMHKDPARRYRTVDALMRDLARARASEPLEARPDTAGYRASKFVRRNRTAVAAASAVLLVLAGLVTFYTLRLARARGAELAEAARAQRIQRFMLNLFEGGDPEAGPATDLRVVSLIERGALEAESLREEPLVQAELFATLGGLSRKLGDLQRAETLLVRALARRRELLGDSHPEVGASLVELARLRSDQARYEEAEALAREAIARPPDARAEGDTQTPARLALGHVLVERGAYADAARVLSEALAMRAPDERTPEVADLARELANAHFYQGHWAEAQTLRERALALARELYGGSHPRVAESLIDLGAIHHEQGRYADAERLYREALAMNRTYYGDHHHVTASNLTVLGRSLIFEERYEEAEPLMREALAIQERSFGADHPRVADAVNEIGSLALMVGRWDDAERAFRRMVAIYRRVYPEGHYLVGIAVSNVGSVYMRSERHVEGEPYFREALAIFLATLPPDHLNVGIARIKLGRTLLRQGRAEEAVRETRAGHDILAKQQEPSVSWLESARKDLAEAYDALGQPQLAARYRTPEAAGP